ncbi:MAG: ribosome recycling factor [Candidatus Gracilibacteria bacterium]|nr:ribosome recycling factor [Candidatus Gracilibacteria bacterium]
MLDKAKDGIKKAISHLETEYSKLQLGRANPAMVEDILVDQYGSLMPIKNGASLTLLDSQTISILPWDKSLVHKIAKAITEENLGLNPQTMADSVMIKIPAMTEDRRKEAVKIAKNMAEEAKVGVRNARADSHKVIQIAKDGKEISEDIANNYEKDLQKMVDDANKQIDEMTKKKEVDIMKI